MAPLLPAPDPPRARPISTATHRQLPPWKVSSPPSKLLVVFDLAAPLPDGRRARRCSVCCLLPFCSRDAATPTPWTNSHGHGTPTPQHGRPGARHDRCVQVHH